MATKTPPAHGERRCYLAGCRRPECADAHKRYCKQYATRRYRHGRQYIDATPAREHLHLLTASGSTHAGIAEVVGVSGPTIRDLAAGANLRTRPETIRRILAIQPEPTPLGYFTTPTGTIRRLQALAVLGYPLHEVADALGIGYSTIRFIVREARQKVSKDLAQRVAILYAARCSTPGPSPTARGMALSRGWYGPVAWDDIDDPAASPEVGEERELGRDELAAYRRQEIEHLASFGIPECDIAERLGMSPAYVHDLLRELRNAARSDRKQVAA